jgi:hypothetical protein
VRDNNSEIPFWKKGGGMRRIGLLGWVCVVLMLVAGSAYGQGVMYGATTAAEYFIIDTSNGSTTPIATFMDPCPGGPPFPAVTEIEYDPRSGRAYAQSANGAFCGFEFDLLTGATIGGAIPTIGIAFNGIEAVGGTWYAAGIGGPGGPSTLYTLDPFSGSSTAIGLTGVGPISGLAYDVENGVMFGCAGGGDTILYTIDLTTGGATAVGDMGIVAGSLEFDDNGNLYAGGGQANAGELYRINTTTAAAIFLGDTGFTTAISGLAFAPAPATVPTLSEYGMMLLALALATLAVVRMKRRRLG